MTWMVYVVGAAVSLAAADVLVKAAAGKVPNSLGMLLYGSMPFAAGVIWCLLDRKGIAAATLTTKGVAFGLGVGVMFATVTFCMYAAFRAGAPISLASPVIRLGGLVVASIAGLVLWKEPMTMRYLMGMGLVCLGIYFMLAR
jgi:drug/metabolite transporter (DMT)-like permease